MRFRATPIPQRVGSLNIGISLTPTAPTVRTAAAAGASSDGAELYVVNDLVLPADIGAPEDANGCSWIVLLMGVSAGSVVEWSVTWEGMDDFNAGGVHYGSLGLWSIGILTSSFDVYWIDVTATVDGVAVTQRIGALRDSGDTAACAF